MDQYTFLDWNIWGGFNPATEAVANRLDLMMQIIDRYDPDICGFQECNPITMRGHDPSVMEKMSVKYAEAAPQYAMRNHTPVFYKKDKFVLIDSGYGQYSGKNDQNSKTYTWAVLSDRATGKRLIAIATHFWWMRDSEDDALQRVRNAEELKAAVDCLVERYALPVIAAGDLNCGEVSWQGDALGYHRLLELGFRDFRFDARETSDSFTTHDYPARDESGNYNKYYLPSAETGTIDYCLTYNADNMDKSYFSVVTDKEALCASDHCPLIAKFAL